MLERRLGQPLRTEQLAPAPPLSAALAKRFPPAWSPPLSVPLHMLTAQKMGAAPLGQVEQCCGHLQMLQMSQACPALQTWARMTTPMQRSQPTAGATATATLLAIMVAQQRPLAPGMPRLLSMEVHLALASSSHPTLPEARLSWSQLKKMKKVKPAAAAAAKTSRARKLPAKTARPRVRRKRARRRIEPGLMIQA